MEMYEDAIQQLICRLTHYMLYVADRLNLFDTGRAKEAMLKNKYSRSQPIATKPWWDMGKNFEVMKTFSLDKQLSKLEAKSAHSPLPLLPRHISPEALRKVTEQMASTHKSAAIQTLKDIWGQFSQLSKFVREEAFFVEIRPTLSEQIKPPKIADSKRRLGEVLVNRAQSLDAAMGAASAREAQEMYLEQPDCTPSMVPDDFIEENESRTNQVSDFALQQRVNQNTVLQHPAPTFIHTSANGASQRDFWEEHFFPTTIDDFYPVSDLTPGIVDPFTRPPEAGLDEQPWYSTRDTPLQESSQDGFELFETCPEEDWLSEYPFDTDIAGSCQHGPESDPNPVPLES